MQTQQPFYPEFRLVRLPNGDAGMVMRVKGEDVAYRPLWRARHSRGVIPHAMPANDR